MWAGVWIDGHHDDALPYLRAIAADAPAPAGPAALPTGAAPHPSAPPPPAPLRRPPAAGPPRCAPSAVLARSSGHCEIITAGCRYAFDRLLSRRRGHPPAQNDSPADLFAACTACAQAVAAMQRQLATRRGYLVDADRDPAGVPFHWRGSRWVLLGRDGWLTELTDDAQTA